jgi:Zn-dependent protease with chaperone function
LDFFEQQERARRTSRWLVVWYLLAAASVVASYCVVAALVYAFLVLWGANLPLRGGAEAIEWRGLFGTYFWVLARVPAQLYYLVGGVVGGFVLAMSAYRVWQLSDGGIVIAHMMGARYVEPGNCTPSERRLLNVVEEMSIASRIALPPVYVLDRETGINALVAGYDPNQAVIIATQGAVQKLSRDELQGIMGHEFSHILNGDMALNLRLVGILAGLTRIGEIGEQMVYRAAEQNKNLVREKRGEGAIEAVVGLLIAFIGFPGTFAASAIKAAVSRQRELLADAASVQFTRNPDALAGALDSIQALRTHTTVGALYTEEFSHMFFAPAVGKWWGFPTHPPVEERILHAHPRFVQGDYRAKRHGTRSEVAVLDGAGNVVKTVRAVPLEGVALAAAMAEKAAKPVDYTARLLGRLPERLRQALRRADEAEAAMFALALEQEPGTQHAELKFIGERRGDKAQKKVLDLYVYTSALARHHMLTLAELAVPAIKEQPQKARDAFLADLRALVEVDRRMTLREFVLVTLLHQRLREGAGQPIHARFSKIEEVSADVQAVVSLIALGSKGGAQAAFAKGAAVLKLGWTAPLGKDALNTVKLGESLERLRHLTGMAKPGILKACMETATADGVMRLPEAEMVRMVAATLDCPVPSQLAAQDPQSLPA